MKQIFILLAACMLLVACEKEIEIDLNSTNPVLVIEGTITNLPGPYLVQLTKTVNFSDGNTYPPVEDAIVIISDNLGNIDTLEEAEPGKYFTSEIIGTPGVTYFLKVESEGVVYDATTTMPENVPLDSLRFNTFSSPTGSDSYSTIPVFVDPAVYGNNYRFILTVNGEQDPTYIILNDNVTNGTVNELPIFSPQTEVLVGDTVQVEMRCTDLAAYNYFFTLSQIIGGGPGGGTTPSNPPNNITGGEALGLFSAYTVQTETSIVE
jgi:Domain of unknown function (DUF4249)